MIMTTMLCMYVLCVHGKNYLSSVHCTFSKYSTRAKANIENKYTQVVSGHNLKKILSSSCMHTLCYLPKLYFPIHIISTLSHVNLLWDYKTPIAFYKENRKWVMSWEPIKEMWVVLFFNGFQIDNQPSQVASRLLHYDAPKNVFA